MPLFYKLGGEIFYFADGQMNKGWTVGRSDASIAIDVDGKGTLRVLPARYAFERDQLSQEEIDAANLSFEEEYGA